MNIEDWFENYLTEEFKKSEAFSNNKVAFENDPSVGVFWILPGGKIVGEVTSIRDFVAQEVIGPKRNHAEVWAEKKEFWGYPEIEDYKYFPRGRVVFSKNLTPKSFLIGTCKLVKENTLLVDRIKNKFHIQEYCDIVQESPNYENWKVDTTTL